MVALLDGGLGGLKVHVDLVWHLFVDFKLVVGVPLLCARSLLHVAAYITSKVDEFVLDPALLVPPL